MSIGEKIKSFRKEKGLTQLQLSRAANMSRTYLADIERDRYNPSVDTLRSIADALNIDVAELISENKKTYHELTEKDERDIAKMLEEMMEGLSNNHSLQFMGEPMEEEERELLRISLENTLRISKQMAKKKFTPKKYRDEEE